MYDSIVIFTQLVEIGNFTKTAEKIGIPPSTLSRKIKELETYFATSLIVRDTRNMQITEHGKLVYSQFKDLRHKLKDTYNSINHIKDNKSSKLLVSLPLQLSTNLITPYLSYFANNHPNIKLTCIYQVTEPELDKRLPDIVITYQHLYHKDYTKKLIRKEYGQLYCTPDYIKKYGSPISIEDLENHNVIGLIEPISKEIITQLKFTNLYTNEEFLFDNAKYAQLNIDGANQVLQAGLSGEHIFGSWNNMCEDLEKQGKLIKVLPQFYAHEHQYYIYYRHRIRKIENDFIEFIERCMNGNIKQDIMNS